MRDFDTVARHILSVIPWPHAHNDDSVPVINLIHGIKEAIRDHSFRAPENVARSWAQLSQAIREYFAHRDPTEDWETEMVAILTDRDWAGIMRALLLALTATGRAS